MDWRQLIVFRSNVSEELALKCRCSKHPIFARLRLSSDSSAPFTFVNCSTLRNSVESKDYPRPTEERGTVIRVLLENFISAFSESRTGESSSARLFITIFNAEERRKEFERAVARIVRIRFDRGHLSLARVT